MRLLLIPVLFLAACTAEKTSDLVADAQSSQSQDSLVSPWASPPENWPKVELRTELGSLFVALNPSVSGHTQNLLKLVSEGFYDGLLFHRIVRDFMVQAGDPNSKQATPDQSLGNGDPGYTLKAEISDSLFHWRGALAMARQPDAVNPKRESSGSQFYIVTGQRYTDEQMRVMQQQRYYNDFFRDPANIDYYQRWQQAINQGDQKGLNALFEEVNAFSGSSIDSMHLRTPERARKVYSQWGGAPSLDGAYTIFGYLYDGYATLDALNKTQTGNADRPLGDLHILQARLLSNP
ncbi:MAG: peptidylprolyl isomerase [Bacteroidia bacterium]